MGKGVCIGTRTMELEAPATLLYASHFAMPHSMPGALATAAWNLRGLPWNSLRAAGCFCTYILYKK